jgi:hypothetical protein
MIAARMIFIIPYWPPGRFREFLSLEIVEQAFFHPFF